MKMMKEVPETIVSVEQMRRSDAYTIEHLVPGKELMYRAAYGVYEAYEGWRGSQIAIVVGGGNNGGDGYALAGILKKDGIDSVIYKVSDRLTGDSGYYRDAAAELGVPIIEYVPHVDAGSESRPADDSMYPPTDLSKYDVIVDCILGTGFKGEVRDKAADAIREINRCGSTAVPADTAAPAARTPAYVISVDINSGMNGDTGEAALAVRSDLTVSIGYYKQGLFLGDAGRYIGSLTNVDIGIVLV